VRWLGALAALAVAGCGGGLSREEYHERGERVLAKAVPAIEKAKVAAKEHPRDPAVYRRLATVLRTFAHDLEAVGDPPSELANRHDEIIERSREGADLWDEAADALARGDTRKFQEKADEALKTVDAAARGGAFG
jgi:hypothetical protein